MTRPIRLGPADPPPARDTADHWTASAACLNDNGIHIMDGAFESQRWWPAAKAICGTCPVRVICAREHRDEPFGVFGGLDPDQRAGLRGVEGTPQECGAAGCVRTFTVSAVTRHGRRRLYCSDACRHAARRAAVKRAAA